VQKFPSPVQTDAIVLHDISLNQRLPKGFENGENMAESEWCGKASRLRHRVSLKRVRTIGPSSLTVISDPFRTTEKRFF
jgi:hypothetical protein